MVRQNLEEAPDSVTVDLVHFQVQYRTMSERGQIVSRLFFALPVPKHVRAQLGEVRRGWEEAERARWRWVEPHLFHLTLAFLGKQPEEALKPILEAGREAAEGHAKFELYCRGIGAFPSNRKPTRTLWAGLETSAPLSHLVSALRDALLSRKIPVDSKPFKAHLTLARRRADHQRSAPPLDTSWSSQNWGAWTVDELVLLESVLGNGPPVYERRAAWRLRTC